MSETKYEPGTVAWATVRGESSYKVMRVVTSRGIRWVSSANDKGEFVHEDEAVTDVRPLVALDPENASDINDLVQHSDFYMPGQIITPLVKALQRGLRQRVKPPRIPEPGKYGVVEASAKVTNAARGEWVNEGKFWRSLDFGDFVEWSELVEPTLIREGISA